ncbi:Pimeloyl-ACP methyl ester carboxylesterase [Paenibacillus sp. UNC496MF]|uniref:alpha/beta fold hydrolase n=1 Tax=Paenibacillus sp. UNC496MF TaxID=1502753 RepID=UPI0008E51396|nr:alpha/beta hydrolase [Paenibacillus sp. UNC496MF]SFI50274.1 Pimeloyl-ACP methyl ester carboxylesterase [Paenibacillus sp. UNC496MF]
MPYARAGDVDMFYEKMGYGEPILFLHSGYSRGILAFAGQLLDFQRGYTCYYPDFRGHGRSRCDSPAWSTPRLAEDAIGFLDALGIAKAHWIGYSLGANVGLYGAALHPGRVATLTTIGTSGFAEPEGADEYEPEWLLAHGKDDTIRLMAERHEEAVRGDWRLYPQLTEAQLGGIRCPSLLVTGEHDPFVGEAKIRRLGALIEGSRTAVIAGGSHRPRMVREYPEQVNDLMLGFVGEHPIGQRAPESEGNS